MASLLDAPADAGLSAIRVLDLAGPEASYGGKVLAELGADVIKVEPPGGDAARRRGPFLGFRPGPGRSLSFAYGNASKRSITLDLTSAAGRALFQALAARAGVILESFPPGAMDRLGLGPETLRRRHPALVYTAVTPYGQSGPYSRHAATDLVAQAMGGLAHRIGMPGQTPNQMGGEQAFYLGGLHAALGSIIALYDREETGLGQLVDVSLQEAVAMTGQDAMPTFDLQGRDIVRTGFRGPTGFAHVCPAKDGWLKFIPLYSRVGPGWAGLLDWMDSKGMTGSLRDPRWEDEAQRNANIGLLEEAVFTFTRTLTRKEAVPQAQRLGYMCMPVHTAADLFEDEQLLARRFFVDVALPGRASPVRYPGPPVRMARTPWRPSRPAPLPGEHNAAIYQGELGLSGAELRALAAAGVL